jgi:23S rRNA (uracil1939-C5)-methyltransferase
VSAIVENGRRLVLSCTGMDREGAATAPHGEFVLHVPGALPQERVVATVAHVSPHLQAGQRHAWAELNEIEQASPDRVAPACPAHGRCTSCPFMAWAYPAQLGWKREMVAQAMAAQPEGTSVPVAECVASPLPLGYRGNAKLVYGSDDHGRLVLGAYAPRSHDIVDMAGCPLSEPALSEVATKLHGLLCEKANRVGEGGLCPSEPERGKVWNPSQGFQPYDEIRRTGVLRYVLMRANAQGKVLVTLVSARATWPQAQALADELAAACPAVCGVVLNVNASTGNVLLGEEEHLLCGSAFIEDDIGPARVRLGSRSFAQANRQVAGQAYSAIVSAAKTLGPIDRVVDAYAGAGGIALSLAPLASEVVAIESTQAAVTTAEAFIATTTGSRVRFLAGDVAEHLAQVGHADMVVLNPPRKGCAPAVLAAVAKLAPRLVAYLSCNPETLARDVAVLARAGLRCTGVTPYDMMAQTPHVEALALLVR